MKVKCINIYNEHTKDYRETSRSLTIGKEYVVFEMLVYFGKDVLYRLASDNNNAPVLFDSAQFEAVSGKIPSNWIISQSEYRLTFSPKAWKELDFWDKVFDHEEEALEIYRKKSREMLEEEIS